MSTPYEHGLSLDGLSIEELEKLLAMRLSEARVSKVTTLHDQVERIRSRIRTLTASP